MLCNYAGFYGNHSQHVHHNSRGGNSYVVEIRWDDSKHFALDVSPALPPNLLIEIEQNFRNRFRHIWSRCTTKRIMTLTVAEGHRSLHHEILWSAYFKNCIDNQAETMQMFLRLCRAFEVITLFNVFCIQKVAVAAFFKFSEKKITFVFLTRYITQTL